MVYLGLEGEDGRLEGIFGRKSHVELEGSALHNLCQPYIFSFLAATASVLSAQQVRVLQEGAELVETN